MKIKRIVLVGIMAIVVLGGCGKTEKNPIPSTEEKQKTERQKKVC